MAYAHDSMEKHDGSQIQFEDINQIDEDDMEEMDIKWNMALLSMRADRFWKKTRKKISIQGTEVAGIDKLKVECFNCHKMGHFARECKAPRSQDKGRRDNYRQGSKVEEQTPKALMAIDGVGWDWSYMANDEENHVLVADEEAPTEFALMAKTSAESEVFDSSLCSKAYKKNTNSLNRYSVVLPPPAQIYSPPKKDDTVTDYSRPSPAIESTSDDAQNRNPSEASPSTISPKPFIKFVKANDSPTKSKTDKVETAKKPPVKKFPTGNTKFFTADMGNKEKAVKASACWFWKPSHNLSNKGPNSNSVSMMFKKYTYVDTQGRLNGCSRHMTGNISYLSDYEPFDGGYVSFGQGGCKITGKGTIKTGKLGFETMYFVKDLKYNMFSVSQIYDNKNNVLFTNSEYIVLGRDFKLLDDANVLLRTPRQHNMYSIDLNNIVPYKDLTCLVAKASADECMIWHRRLGHLNFKTVNKLVRHNLVRGLPTKCFENDHTCTAFLKGKQHKASCKSKLVNSVTKPLHTLHMDLFGPTSVSSISHKWYCLVVTDDFSRFTWTFFLKTKDETSGILRKFITEIENLKDLKVKIIRTPQQNGVAKRRNRTLIEAARTMLADAKLPVAFWAEAVNTGCYVQNRVLVNKSQNKTPYELFNGRTPTIGFLKPFGYHVMILNTLDNLGKYEAKGDEGYFIGYSMSSKAFRVFNKRTKRVEENLHVEFLENKAIEKGAGPNWLFNIDSLTKSMNYVTVVHDDLLESSLSKPQDDFSTDVPESSGNSNPTATSTNPSADQMETIIVETPIPTVSSPVLTACLNDTLKPLIDTRLISKRVASHLETPSLDNILTLTNRFEDILGVTTHLVDSDGVEADVSNMETTIKASPNPTLRIHMDHPKSQIICPVDTRIQTKNKSKGVGE
uniref:Uncharacterized protein n=1 Tax=Tanacetum cinerariifolium TaxID=118510 RepID=A0A6L2K9K2_TANCI|nr:hypothetical protein [Tanacetum cinerariifolium]